MNGRKIRPEVPNPDVPVLAATREGLARPIRCSVQIDRTYGGRSTWVAAQGGQVPQVCLGIEVNGIHRGRSSGCVAVGQGSYRQHVCVGRK